MQSSNLKNHIGAAQYGVDFSNYTFHKDITQSQEQVQSTVETILNSQRIVIYKNKKGHLFYVLWGTKEENGRETRRISQVTPVKGFHQLSQKERFLIESDLNNNTQFCGLKPVQSVEYKPILSKIVETHHREKKIMNMNGTFSYQNTTGKIIQVEIEKGKITSAKDGQNQVSTQQKAAIQKMILMGKFEKFRDIKLQAANDEVYFEDAPQETGESVVKAQSQTSESVEKILTSSEVDNEQTSYEEPVSESQYPNMKGTKEVLGKKKATQSTQESPKEEDKQEPQLDLKLVAYYKKIAETYKYFQIIESKFFSGNMSGVNAQSLSHIQLFAVVDFIEYIAKEYQIEFTKKVLLNEKETNKFFKRLFTLFHPDRESHTEVKAVKNEIMQSLQHIKSNYLEGSNLAVLFPKQEARGYHQGAQNKKGSFSARA